MGTLYDDDVAAWAEHQAANASLRSSLSSVVVGQLWEGALGRQAAVGA